MMHDLSTSAVFKQPNLNFSWCSIYVDQLIKNGLSQVVISPGSRSTPLTLAFARRPEVKTIVAIDERSAAFIASGICRSSNKSCALVCTSGTALAHYLPAIIEANLQALPLVVLSADRPSYLIQTGASQAIDQKHIFGTHAYFIDAKAPFAHKDSFKEVIELAEKTATSWAYGPVHINLPFDKPLEPSLELYQKQDLEEEIYKELSLASSSKVAHSSSVIDKGVMRQILELISASKRPLVIAGPANIKHEQAEAIEYLASLGIPVIGETASQVNDAILIKGAPAFLRNEELQEHLKADLILSFGQSPTHKGTLMYVSNTKEATHIQFNAYLKDPQDTFQTVDHLIRFKVDASDFKGLSCTINKDWLNDWKTQEAAFLNYRQTGLAKTNTLNDASVFNEITSHYKDSDLDVYLSNSFPVRDYDIFKTAEFKAKNVFTWRGASGIDGIISSAIGGVLSSKTDALLFIGDIAFLHDTNALLSACLLVKNQLDIILINNGGGTIFNMLPIADNPDVLKTYFHTPQDVNIEALAAAYGCDYIKIRTLKELKDLKSISKEKKMGIRIIECITNATESLNIRKQLWSQHPKSY